MVSILQNIVRRQSHFYNWHLTSADPNLHHTQSRRLHDHFELRRRSLNSIDDPHHCKVTLVAIPCIVTVVRKQGWRSGVDFWTAKCGIHHLITDQDTRVAVHGRANCWKNLYAVIIRPVVSGFIMLAENMALKGKWTIHDISQPIDIGPYDRILGEEIVLHERDTIFSKRLGVFFGPYDFLSLFKDRATILNNEFKIRIKST